MNALEYAKKFVDSDTFDNYVQNAYWNRRFNPETVVEIMIRDAVLNNILLDNLEYFDYDNFFYKAYLDSEKGLS